MNATMQLPRFKTARDEFDHWLSVCAGMRRTAHIKSADIEGGDSMPFEQAFSNLAHAYLKDKAPQLLNYELGFQLLDKNEDNNKAAGMFGFKVGSQMMYAPVNSHH